MGLAGLFGHAPRGILPALYRIFGDPRNLFACTGKAIKPLFIILCRFTD